MTKKIGDKKIESVTSAQGTDKVSGADTVTGVTKVKGAETVGGVGAVSGITSKRRATQIMGAHEREEFFKKLVEEADKFFVGVPEEKKKIVTDAVKMAISAGAVDDE